MPKTVHDVATIAEHLIAGRRKRAPIPPLDPGSLDACYAVQRAVVEAIGTVGGFKTARRIGEPQIMAPIFAADIRLSPGAFDRSVLHLIGIELEIGFRVRAPLPEPGSVGFPERLRECVDLVPTLEIVDTRFGDIEGASALARLADNQINGGLVVGEPVSDWQGLDLSSVTARLELGEDVVLDGPAPVPGGDAFETFLRFAEMVGDHCGGLRPGHVVITGSLNGLPFIERGTRVRGWIAGLGSVEAAFPA